MPLQNAHVIDLIAIDPDSQEAVLGMTELRPWDGTEHRVFELQEKVNSYLSFALDGEMEENMPQLAGRNVRLQLDCVAPPDEMTEHFIGIIREQIGFQGIQFVVRVIPNLAEMLVAAPAQGGCCGGSGRGGCCNEEPEHSHAASESASGCCGGGSNTGHCGCA